MKINIGKLFGKVKQALPYIRVIAPKVVPPVAVAIEVVDAVDALEDVVKKPKR